MTGYVPIANYAEVGAVKPDGATIDVAPDGTLSVDASVTEAPPHLELTDGITDVGRVSKITVAHMVVGGTSDAATLAPELATTVSPGIMQPDGATLFVDQDGIERAVTATGASLGVVQPDTVTIDINPEGIISVPIATTDALGVVQPDGTTIHVDAGGVISAVEQGIDIADATHDIADTIKITFADTAISGSAADVTVTPNTATTGRPGIVQPDGTTINISAGVLSAAVATTSHPGIVQPDGSTIDVSAGVISAAIATGATLGIVQPDNTTVNIDGGGVISVPIMNGSTEGLSKPDGTSIVASAPGILHVPLATTSTPGEVQPDGTTIHVDGSGVISAAAAGVAATDGGTSVAGATSLHFAHATVSGSTPNATITPATATTAALGMVKADGTTIDVASDGTISVDASIIGGAPNLELTDGTHDLTHVSKITTSHMVVGGSSAAATLAPSLGTTAAPGILQPDGTTIDVAAGVINAATATGSTLGVSRPDDTTIYIDSSGVLHVGSGSAGTSFVSDASARCLALWNGSSNNSPPSGWETLSFDDSAWASPVDTGAQGGSFGAARDLSAYNPPPSTTVGQLFRMKFTIPPGTYTGASLQIDIADNADGVWINGTAISGTTGAGTPHFLVTVSVPISLLIIGHTNVLALHADGADGTASASESACAWDLTLTHNSVTEPSALSVSHNGELVGTEQDVNFIDGANVTLTVSDNPTAGRVDVTIASTGGAGTPAAQTGSASITISAGNADNTAAIAFGSAFGTSPLVLCSSSDADLIASAESITTTGFTARLRANVPLAPGTTVTATLTWMAQGSGSSGGAGSLQYINVQNQQSSGTNGGSTSSGAWNTLVLNTIAADTASIASLASNQLTVPAGTYTWRAVASIYNSARCRIRLFNVTTSSVIGAPGLNGFDEAIAYALPESSGSVILSGTTALRLEYQTEANQATNGLGVASSMGTEVYVVLEMWKIA